MGFTGSLRNTGLLLWKNTLLTIRRPVSLAFELLIPLKLYVALLVLRSFFPPDYYEDQHFRPMALPSAGLLPFAQTLICDLSTTNSNFSADMPYFPNANVSQVYDLLGDTAIDEVATSFCDSLINIQSISSCRDPLLEKITNGQGQDIKFGDLLSNEDSFRRFLSDNLQLQPDVIDDILQATINTNLGSSSLAILYLQSILGSGGDILDNLNGEKLRVLVCDDPFLDSFIEFPSAQTKRKVTTALCNMTDVQFQALATELQDQLSNHCKDLLNPDSIRKISQLLNILSLLPSVSSFSQPSNFGETYSLIHDFLCGSTLPNTYPADLLLLLSHITYGDFYQKGRLMANLTNLPHKIAPKVLYSPNNTVTNNIMEYANMTFKAVQELLTVLEQIDNCSTSFVTDNPPDGELAEQLEAYLNSPLFSTLSGLNQATLESLQSLLVIGSSNNIWNRTEELHEYIVLIEKYIHVIDWDVFYPVNSEDEMIGISFDKGLQKELGMSSVFAGIVFDEDIGQKPLKDVNIKIRMNSTYVHDTKLLKEKVWFEGPEGDLLWKRRYLGGGFVFLQDMVERAAIEEIVGHRVATPGAYVHQMPYHCFSDDLFLVGVQFLLPLTMCLGWMLSVAMIVRAIVREKESRMKEVMQMMGLGRGQLWGSWFITSFVTLSFSVAFITCALKFGGFLTHTNGLILFLYLMAYSAAVIMYCFMVSLFFTNANMGACVAALAYFLFFFVQIVVLDKLSILPVPVVLLLCLLLPVAFALGCTIMVQFELKLVGLQLTNMFESTFPENQFNFGMVVIMIFVDIVVYGLVVWYIEAVFPGKYGVSKPWYFPVQPLLKLYRRLASTETISEEEELLTEGGIGCHDDDLVCEDEPEGLVKGIQIQELSKTYRVGCKRKVKALKKLNLNLFEGQITAFLGHNGAGKTTTMSILTGLYEPSKGTALIYGKDIRKNMDEIRNSLGICPQHNVLFDDLTVEEHFLFFAQLKGMKYSQAKQQVPGWLKRVNLDTHRNARTKNLSGGMKRKLSILLAFVGDSKTVILDEPTSGVDPYARTQIWDFLSQLKNGRTIMLSTHHMDEAEVLGDRIAIISKGNLLCTGSFEFLKGKFGRGHYLTVVMDTKTRPSIVRDPLSGQEDEDVDSENTDSSEKITSYLKRHIPDASLSEKGTRELCYLLPLQQSRPVVLKDMFRGIDDSRDDLGIAHYGMASCTMEEIFIELTQKEFDDVSDTRQEGGVAGDEGSYPHRTLLPRGSSGSFKLIDEEEVDGSPEEEVGGAIEDRQKIVSEDPSQPILITGLHLFITQYLALLVKRFHFTKRNRKLFFVQNILPLFVIGFCLFISHSLLSVYDPPDLLMHPSMFFKLNKENYLFASQNNSLVSHDFYHTLRRPCGIGAKYLGNPNDTESVCYANMPPDGCHGYPTTLGQCNCRNCTRAAITQDVPECYNGTVTGTRIQDMNGYTYDELTSYLVSTKTSFIEERYGGVSFGHRRGDIPHGADTRYNSDINSTTPILAVQEGAKAWFSYKGYHSLPAFLNTLNNAILRAHVPTDNITEYGISSYSHPFPTTELQKLQSAIEEASFLVNPMAAMFALGFVVAGFVLAIIEERSSKFLHLQQVCGLDRVSYWLSNFTWDLVSYLLISVVVLAIYAVAQDNNFSGTDVLFSMFLLFLCYGLSMTPWMYVYSYLFESPRTAYVMLFCLNFFSGLLLLIIDAVVVSQAFDYDDSTFSYWLSAVPMPSYIIARGMMYFTLDRIVEQVDSTITQAPLPHPLVKIWPYIVALIIHGVIAIAILLLIQLCQYKTSFSFRNLKNVLPIDNEDSEVTEERKRVCEGHYDGCPLLLNNLTKVYTSKSLTSLGWRSKGKSLTAVNQLSLGLQQTECFGLLGLNGAGKTTTFKMITGDTRCNSGDASVNGISVNKSVSRARRSIGYCPQFDALSGSLTGREHLVLICRLRGIPSKDIDSTVTKAISRLELDSYADRPVYTYSGGNMRRLSTAVALIADPPVLLLDEPTSGVDPRARQFLWATIKKIASSRHAVLLTTHNMVECETLCTRIGIMVNGELKCIGTPQELKSKFGRGYILKLRVPSMDRKEQTKTFIQQSFSSAVLKEEHHNTLMYGLPPGLPLSNVYQAIEGARAQLDIDDYSLSQTTLDDVFIHFVKEQREEGVAADISHAPDSGLELRIPADNPSVCINDTVHVTTDTTQL